jgi:hypothetical protein
VAYYGWYEIRLLHGGAPNDPVVATATTLQHWLAAGLDRLGVPVIATVFGVLLAAGLVLTRVRRGRGHAVEESRRSPGGSTPRVRRRAHGSMVPTVLLRADGARPDMERHRSPRTPRRTGCGGTIRRTAPRITSHPAGRDRGYCQAAQRTTTASVTNRGVQFRPTFAARPCARCRTRGDRKRGHSAAPHRGPAVNTAA